MFLFPLIIVFFKLHHVAQMPFLNSFYSRSLICHDPFQCQLFVVRKSAQRFRFCCCIRSSLRLRVCIFPNLLVHHLSFFFVMTMNRFPFGHVICCCCCLPSRPPKLAFKFCMFLELRRARCQSLLIFRRFGMFIPLAHKTSPQISTSVPLFKPSVSH